MPTLQDNLQHAKSLRKLADTYETIAITGDRKNGITQSSLMIFVHDKKDLVEVLRAVGGRFTKKLTDYNAELHSLHIPGLVVYITRSLVCRRLNPEYECDPLLTTDEQGEIDAEFLTLGAGA